MSSSQKSLLTADLSQLSTSPQFPIGVCTSQLDVREKAMRVEDFEYLTETFITPLQGIAHGRITPLSVLWKRVNLVPPKLKSELLSLQTTVAQFNY